MNEPTTTPEPDSPENGGLPRISRRRALTLLAGGSAAALFLAARQSGGSSNVSAAANPATSTGSAASTGADAAASSTSTSAGSSTAAGSGAASGTSTTAKRATTSNTAQPATTSTTAAPTTTTATGSGSPLTVACAGPIPRETAGPYPGDGTNGPNVLTQSGVVRADIRRGVGSATAVADGVPLTVELALADADTCQVLPGAAVYLWHCDRLGRYSMYSGLANENYLRGVQVADANGVLRFTTIFPGAYSGRWPHIHFEVFDSVSKATSGRNAVATSQLALPESVCRQVYGTAGYESSASNMSRTSLSSDNVFRDGWDLEMATVTGSTASGYTAKLVVGI